MTQRAIITWWLKADYQLVNWVDSTCVGRLLVYHTDHQGLFAARFCPSGSTTTTDACLFCSEIQRAKANERSLCSSMFPDLKKAATSTPCMVLQFWLLLAFWVRVMRNVLKLHGTMLFGNSSVHIGMKMSNHFSIVALVFLYPSCYPWRNCYFGRKWCAVEIWFRVDWQSVNDAIIFSLAA